MTLGCLLFWLGTANPAARAANATWTNVMPQRVADAISAAGAPISPEQVEFLDRVRATSEAKFVVTGAENQNRDAVTVRLRCQSSRECVPFYVLVHGANVARSLGYGGAKVPAMSSAGPAGAEKLRVVKGGDRATLILEGTAMRIVMPVICLQNGARGQTIRVSSRDHKKTYLAEVVETGLLKGTL
jgi:hypothetical protein